RNVVTTLPAVELHVRVDGRGDRARQVYQQVRAAIADGLLRPGEAVPSSRELARRLGVARNTVTLAYDRLTAEGFLRSRVGAGTFVCAEGLSPVSRPPADSPLRPRSLWDGVPRARLPGRRGAGGRGRPGRRRAPGTRPAGLREPVAPVPARDGDVAAQAPGPPGLGRTRRRRRRRGRLRQRVPLRGPTRRT